VGVPASAILDEAMRFPSTASEQSGGAFDPAVAQRTDDAGIGITLLDRQRVDGPIVTAESQQHKTGGLHYVA
jgi:hypothetical protein